MKADQLTPPGGATVTGSTRRRPALTIAMTLLVGMAAVILPCCATNERNPQDTQPADDPTRSPLSAGESEPEVGGPGGEEGFDAAPVTGGDRRETDNGASIEAETGEDEEDYPEIAQFYGQTYEGWGFFLVIDRSQSMQTSGELDIAKREVVRLLTELSDQVWFGIVFFDEEVVKFPKSGRAAPANPSTKAAAISWVQTVRGGTGSCAQEGLIAALTMANSAPARRQVIVYVGDGGDACEDKDPEPYLAQTLAACKGANFQRFECNTIGVLELPPAEERFLRDLASMSGGSYTRITR